MLTRFICYPSVMPLSVMFVCNTYARGFTHDHRSVRREVHALCVIIIFDIINYILYDRLYLN
jgi:hypothetical protein